jgi:glycosyltransferase involved in cell wall biosynthesis
VLIGKGNGKINSDDSMEIHRTIEELALQDEVIMPGYLADELLSVVYQNASLYVFPSINEGFGIPILEAFQFEVPVIVANNTCLPEVGAEAVISFDPFESEDIYQKMAQVLNDKALQETMKQKGQERLKLFSWNKTAMSLLAIFEKAVQK